MKAPLWLGSLMTVSFVIITLAGYWWLTPNSFDCCAPVLLSGYRGDEHACAIHTHTQHRKYALSIYNYKIRESCTGGRSPCSLLICSCSSWGDIQEEEDEQPRAVVMLPYMRGVAEVIRRVLMKVNIKTCFQPHRILLQLLVHPKDPIPPKQRRGIVYRIPCGSCDMSYVGQTGRTLDLCKKEHQRALVNGDINLSALAEHALEQYHAIAWDQALVLDSNRHVYQRCALESWHIQRQQEPINSERGLLHPANDSLILYLYILSAFFRCCVCVLRMCVRHLGNHWGGQQHSSRNCLVSIINNQLV